MNYIGAACPICGQKFADGDDIVVCPDCGTPYHRSCYKEKGRCIMDEFHASGKEWVNPVKPKKEYVQQPTVAACPRCGHPNAASAFRCEDCGFPLSPDRRDGERDLEQRNRLQEEVPASQADPLEDIFGRIDPNATIQKIRIMDIMGFTQKNTQYFVRLFKLLNMEISTMVFNWCALFFGPFYYFYRKMYKKGFVLLLIELASYLPSFAIAYHLMPQAISNPALLETLAFNTNGMEGLMTIANLASNIPLFVHLYSGFTANKSYYFHSMGLLKEIYAKLSSNRHEMEKQILHVGGVSPTAVVAALIGTCLLFLGISFAIVMLLLPLMA